eukprot:TRINITY_DN8747_c0_g1_i1.p1 TRINITY_DN8747_c0_g1~~TRINITY_DN8747_c0_g1_i1.p1  ORF type:complete len:329 (+),score=66.10 TRINITY_DN8747_c0_g1_i1:105-1091(+)
MVFTAKRTSSASDVRRANRSGTLTTTAIPRQPSRPLAEPLHSTHTPSSQMQSKFSISFTATGSKTKLTNQHADEMYYADNDEHHSIISHQIHHNRDQTITTNSTMTKPRMGSSSGSSIQDVVLSDIDPQIVLTGSRAPLRQQRAVSTKTSVSSQNTASTNPTANRNQAQGFRGSVPKVRPTPSTIQNAAQAKIHSRVVTGKTNISPNTSPSKGHPSNSAPHFSQSGEFWASSSTSFTASSERFHSAAAMSSALHRSTSPPAKSPKTAKVEDFHAKTLQRIAEKKEQAREEQQKVISIAKAMEDKKHVLSFTHSSSSFFCILFSDRYHC